MLHDVVVRLVKTVKKNNATIIINKAKHIARRSDDAEIIPFNRSNLDVAFSTGIQMLHQSCTLYDVLLRVELWMHQSLKCCPLTKQIAVTHLSFVRRLERLNEVRF